MDREYYKGKEFVIIAKNVSEGNMYIQSIILNGKKLDRMWIDHSEIVNGGTLILEMGNNPKLGTIEK